LEKQKILRIIDANLNRSREGLRVCEDIVRFLLDDAESALRLKKARQSIFTAVKTSGIPYEQLLEKRNSNEDVGKQTTKSEQRRPDWQSVFLANIERAKEALRALEECSKIINKKLGEKFKKIRFVIYAIEKEIIIKHKSLSGGKHHSARHGEFKLPPKPAGLKGRA